MGKSEYLERLYHEIHSCRKCPMVIASEEPRKVNERSLDSSIILMAQAPSESGVRKSGIHWVKRDGTLTNGGRNLEKYLSKIAYSVIPKEMFKSPYTTNVLHCWTGKQGKRDRPPNETELLYCRPWWIKEFEIIRPRVLLLLGAKAVSSFSIATSEKLEFKDLLKNQGKSLSLNDMELYLFAVPHPVAPYKEKEYPYRTISEIYAEVFNQLNQYL